MRLGVLTSPLLALLGEIVSYRPDGSAHALPEGSALGGLLDCQADAEAISSQPWLADVYLNYTYYINILEDAYGC